MGLTAADLDLPSKEFWEPRKSWLYICLIIAFLVSATSQTLNALAVKADAVSVRAFEAEVEAAMAATLLRVVKCFGVGVDQVGVHVFLFRGGFIWGQVYGRLVLVGRLRIGARPRMHRPRWAPGKGVVGRAWQSNNYVAEDWADVRDKGMALGPEKWHGLPAVQRYGMSWQELEASREYRLIAARPIINLVDGNGRASGCVVIDAQCGLPTTHTELQSILAELASSIEELEAPPKAWLSQRKHGY